MSKSRSPAQYGETKDNCPRTYFVLKAWMLWRARRKGWAEARACRRNEFNHVEQRLEDPPS